MPSARLISTVPEARTTLAISVMYSTVANSTGMVAPEKASRMKRSVESSQISAVASRPPWIRTFVLGTDLRLSCERTSSTSPASGSTTICREPGRVAAT